jgi:DNA-binding NarL/FixJ family response regulator
MPASASDCDPELRHSGVHALTPRELEVLRAVAEGLSNRRIGQKLTISERTVKAHMHIIFRKLRVASRTEAVVLGIKTGYVQVH